MQAARLALVALAFAAPLGAESSSVSTAPFYTSASIVNAASQGALSPNSIATIYGSNLSYNTRAVLAADISAGALPTFLGGVTVYVSGIAANLYFVSPGQINFLVPNLLQPGSVKISVVREGLAGVPVTVSLLEIAPGLFQTNANAVIATHADGTIVSQDAPAAPSEVVVLYAAGLGRTNPDELTGRLAPRAAPIQHLKDLRVLLGGAAVDADRILYAGVTPGFAGLYQVNVKLPDSLDQNPDVQLAIGDAISVAGVKISGPRQTPDK